MSFYPAEYFDYEVHVNTVEEEIRKIPGATCAYEYGNFFDLSWKGRVYVMGTVNGCWQYQSADEGPNHDDFGPNSQVSLPLTATTSELIEFIKTNILI